MIALSTTRRGAACVRRRQASPASAAGAVRAARSAAVPVANGAATAAVAAGSADEDGCRRLGARAPAAHSTVCAQRAASRGRRGGGPGRQRCGARDVGSEKLARRAASRARGRRARGAVQELRVCPPASGETMRAETPERTGTERTRGRARLSRSGRQILAPFEQGEMVCPTSGTALPGRNTDRPGSAGTSRLNGSDQLRPHFRSSPRTPSTPRTTYNASSRNEWTSSTYLVARSITHRSAFPMSWI